MEYHKHAKYRKFKTYYGVPPSAETLAEEDSRPKLYQQIGDVAIALIFLLSVTGNGYQYFQHQDEIASIPLMEDALYLAEAKIFRLDEEVGLLQIRNGDLLRANSVHREKNEYLVQENKQLVASNKELVMQKTELTVFLGVVDRDKFRLDVRTNQLSYQNVSANPTKVLVRPPPSTTALVKT